MHNTSRPQSWRQFQMTALFLIGSFVACAQTPGPRSLDVAPGVPSGSRSIVVAAVPAAASTAAFSQSSKPRFRDIRNRIRSTTDTVVLARVDATTITNQLLRARLNVAKPKEFDRLPVETIMALPGPDLARVIANLGFYDMANSEALQDEDFVSTELATMLAGQRTEALKGLFFQKEAYEKNPPMTDEEARAWYKNHRDQFTQPFTFTARSIFLSTYRPYTVRKGDTIEKIATELIGDPRAIGRILDPRTSAPYFESLKTFRLLPISPPNVGDTVMVPTTDEQRRVVRKRIESIAEQLRNGADFVQLAKAHSEVSANVRGQVLGPLPTPGRPMLDIVLDAAAATTIGRVTPILDTRHGFLILQILAKTDTPVLPYEQVRGQLISQEVKQRRDEALKAIAQSLFEDPLLRVDRRALMTDNAPDDLVVARAGDFAYTWGDYRRDTRRRFSAPKTYEGRVSLFSMSESLREAIIQAKARAMGLDRDPVIVERLGAYEVVFRGMTYLEWYLRNRVVLGEEKLRQFYLEERNQFREPGRYRVRELIVQLDPEDVDKPKKIKATMEYLREVAADARSERRFAGLARDEGNWPVPARQRGDLKWVEENYRGEEFVATLANLEPGRCAGPFKIGEDIFLVWVRDRSKLRYRSFASAREDVESLYRRRRQPELLAIAEKDIRARHRLEYLFTFEEEEKTKSADRATTAPSP